MSHPSPEADMSRCPIDHVQATSTQYEYEQATGPDSSTPPDLMREHMLNWYRTSGFRGCLFNKVAARDAQTAKGKWLVPVEYEPVENLTSTDAGQRVIRNFDTIIGDGSKPGLVSYMFPGIEEPKELGDLIKYLAANDPDRFRLLDVVNRVVTPDSNDEFVGIQFRIKVGETDDGSDALAYPMVYNPWGFTTFARRYDVPMITFNRFNNKMNPDTPDTFIGVDDIDLTDSLKPETFNRMLEGSLSVRGLAHSMDGRTADGPTYSRELFRAHNALVLPSAAWDTNL